MFNKATFFNLALQALLLSRQIANIDNDKSNEKTVLEGQWKTVLKEALADLDLDSTSTQAPLELMHDFSQDAPPPSGQAGPQWRFAYRYPDKCAFFRKIVTNNVSDDRATHIPKRVMIWQGKKVIMCDLPRALAEYIPTDFPMQTLSAAAGRAIALRLAWSSAPLIVGKGAKGLRDSLIRDYARAKAEAQAIDERESFSFQTEENMSEFVKTRLE